MAPRHILAYLLKARSETAVVREEDETPNDRNDRGVYLYVIIVT